MAVSVAGRVLSKELTDDRSPPAARRRDQRAARGAGCQRPRRESLMPDAQGADVHEAPADGRRFGRGRPPLRRGPDRRGRARGGRRPGARRARRARARRLEAQPAVRPGPGLAAGLARPRKTASWSTCSRTAPRACCCGFSGCSIATSGSGYLGAVAREARAIWDQRNRAGPGPGSLGRSRSTRASCRPSATGSPS